MAKKSSTSSSASKSMHIDSLSANEFRVELDGEVHFTEEAAAYDAKRTAYLNSVGVQVVRFENFEVFQYPMRTLDEIRKYLK